MTIPIMSLLPTNFQRSPRPTLLSSVWSSKLLWLWKLWALSSLSSTKLQTLQQSSLNMIKPQFISEFVCQCCDKEQEQKQCGKGRVYFPLQVTAHHQGKSRQTPRGGSWSKHPQWILATLVTWGSLVRAMENYKAPTIWFLIFSPFYCLSRMY